MSLYPSELSEEHGQKQLSGLALLGIEHDISFKMEGKKDPRKFDDPNLWKLTSE